ncbi:unnamed protein product [Diabrotica balteata]|uniref:Uncharacterized protein n=1 Tax=Diabrotica balteata TaxID=107213 RepID=A0A9P0GSN8_DIABA|nr:unnamed protein product [Diabrotica balteata]
MSAINKFGQRQNSRSRNLMKPNRQGNKLSGAARRRIVVEEMLAANSSLLSEAEMKTMNSMFSIEGQPKVCIRDPFKGTAYSDKGFRGVHEDLPCNFGDDRRNHEHRNARYVSETKKPQTMAEAFSRQSHSSKFTVDNRSSSSRGYRSNAAENRNETNRFSRETRDISPFNRQRSPYICQRSPLNHERSSLERNRSLDNPRYASNMSLERRMRDERIDFRTPRDDPYELDRIERYQDRSHYPMLHRRN